MSPSTPRDLISQVLALMPWPKSLFESRQKLQRNAKNDDKIIQSKDLKQKQFKTEYIIEFELEEKIKSENNALSCDIL